MNEVNVLIGAGSIGQAIVRRVSAGKQVLLADLRQQNLDAAAKVLGDVGFEVTTAIVDISSREAVRWGKRGARVNTISPGSIFTPLARDELTGPCGARYRNMIEKSPANANAR